MATNRITELQLSDPASPLDVVTLNSDASGNVNIIPRGVGKLVSTDAQFDSALVLNSPVAATDATNKQYVDTIAAGFTFKNPCQASTTANLSATYNNGTAGVSATLTNSGALAAFAVDGYTASLNDRILVKNQTLSQNNGIYLVTTVGSGAVAWILIRATDYDSPSEIVPGSFIGVINGTANAGSFWVETSTITTVGTDPITFTEFGSAITYPIAVNLGGTGATTQTNHGVMIGHGTSAVTAAAATGTGQILRSPGTGSDPAFTIMSYLNACTPNTLFGCTTSNTMTAIGPATNSVLVTNGTGTGVPSLSQTLPTAVQGNITSTGTVASGTWHGTVIGAQYGGTGLATVTSHGLMVGAGTSNVATVAPSATAGALLASQGAAADPAYLVPTAGAGLSLTTNGTTLQYSLAASTVAIKSASYTLLTTDFYIGVSTASGAFTMTLPAAPTSGLKYVIKDVDGSAATNNITIAGNGKNIDASASYAINNAYGAVSLIYNGTAWSIY